MIFRYLPPKQQYKLYRYHVGKNKIIENDEQFECISDDVNQVKYITTSSSIADTDDDCLPSEPGHQGHLQGREARHGGHVHARFISDYFYNY